MQCHDGDSHNDGEGYDDGESNEKDGRASVFPSEAPLPRAERMLTRGQVAAIFRVSPRTVERWTRAGLLTSSDTPLGRRRYGAEAVQRVLRERTAGRSADDPEQPAPTRRRYFSASQRSISSRAIEIEPGSAASAPPGRARTGWLIGARPAS